MQVFELIYLFDLDNLSSYPFTKDFVSQDIGQELPLTVSANQNAETYRILPRDQTLCWLLANSQRNAILQRWTTTVKYSRSIYYIFGLFKN